MDPGNVVGLGEVHRAVTPGADEADPDGAAFLLAVDKEFVKVHWSLSSLECDAKETRPPRRRDNFLVAFCVKTTRSGTGSTFVPLGAKLCQRLQVERLHEDERGGKELKCKINPVDFPKEER
ncbi:hypothetical protein GCM10027405_13240 [Arthrobacter alkaliphilus]